MTFPAVLVATWRNGLFCVTGDEVRQELEDVRVTSPVCDGKGGVLAIVGGNTVSRRNVAGRWTALATSDADLACCIVAGGVVYAGTDDARVLRLNDIGAFEPLPGFERVAGRDEWYAGTAVINGQVLGPPLGVRSMTATCDAAVILANVHVGGIPRSVDGGATWRPTIEIAADVHQVLAHPTHPQIVSAAAGVGLGVSRDAGRTWTLEHEGLHSPYCSAVAFVGDDIFVAASTDHFAEDGAVYRRRLDGSGPLQPLAGGFPRWMEGIADTGRIAARGAAVAIADRAGNLYRSNDFGQSWTTTTPSIPFPSWLVLA